MTPRGRPKLPPGRKAVSYSTKLYPEDIAELKRLADVIEESEAETIRQGLEALDRDLEGVNLSGTASGITEATGRKAPRKD